MDTRFLIVGIIALSVVLVGCTAGNTATDTGGSNMQAGAATNLQKAPLSTQSIADAVNKDGPVVILFFWFPQGSPCQAQDAILQDIKARMGDSIEIVYLATTDQAAAPAWNNYFAYGVRGPPTTVVLTDSGYIVDIFPGLTSEQTLTSSIVKARNS